MFVFIVAPSLDVSEVLSVEGFYLPEKLHNKRKLFFRSEKIHPQFCLELLVFECADDNNEPSRIDHTSFLRELLLLLLCSLDPPFGFHKS